MDWFGLLLSLFARLVTELQVMQTIAGWLSLVLSLIVIAAGPPVPISKFTLWESCASDRLTCATDGANISGIQIL